MIKLWTLILFFAPALAFAAPEAMAGGLQLIEANPLLAVLGLVLIILEFMLPTKGLLGLLGVVFFALGTSALATTPNVALHLTWPQIIALNVLVTGTVLFVAIQTVRDYFSRNRAATEILLDAPATVIEWSEQVQRVETGGAVWSARGQATYLLQPGDRVTVVGRDNLTLIVTPGE